MKTVKQIVVAGRIIPCGTDVADMDIPAGGWLPEPVEETEPVVEAEKPVKRRKTATA